MSPLPPKLAEAKQQVMLCAAGIDEAPSIPVIGRLFRHCLSPRRYFVMAKEFEFGGRRLPWRLIVMKEDKKGDNQLIHDTERKPLTDQKLCQWFLDQLSESV